MEIISSKYLLPIDQDAVIENGAIAVELGKIVAVGARDELMAKFNDANVEDHPDLVLMPGLVNAHTHLDLAGVVELGRRPLTDTAPQIDYIDWLIKALNSRGRTNLATIIGNIQGAINHMIVCGTTCIGDMTAFEGTPRILEEMGIRATVFPEIYGGAGSDAQERFEGALALVERYAEIENDRIEIGLGPFAPYLLSRNLLKIISEHARHGCLPVAIHAAESFAEMEFFYDSKGPIATELFPNIGWSDDLPPPHHKTPIQYLGEIGFLDASPAIIGGLHMGLRDFTTIARNTVRVVYCPRTNHYLGHGNFPFGKLTEHGVPIGIGTDTLNGPTGFDLLSEMRFVSETVITPVPTAKDLLKMATIGGARVLGLEHKIGSLTPGKSADYILIDAPTCPMPSMVYELIIKHTKPANVKRVVVEGEILKS